MSGVAQPTWLGRAPSGHPDSAKLRGTLYYTKPRPPASMCCPPCSPEPLSVHLAPLGGPLEKIPSPQNLWLCGAGTPCEARKAFMCLPARWFSPPILATIHTYICQPQPALHVPRGPNSLSLRLPPPLPLYFVRRRPPAAPPSAIHPLACLIYTWPHRNRRPSGFND